MRFYFRAIAYYRQDLPLILASLGIIGLSTLASLLQPFMLGILIDTIFPAGEPSEKLVNQTFSHLSRSMGFSAGDKVRQVMLLAGITLLLRVFQEALNFVQTMLTYHIGYNGLLRIRCDMFRKLQQLSLGYHKSQPQGDAIYRLSWDACGLQTILNVLLKNIFVGGITLVLMTFIMFQLNPALAIITLSVAPALLLVTKMFSGRLKQRWLEAKETESQLTTVMQRSVASIGLVQAFGREADEFERFQTTAQSSIRANLRQAMQDALYWLIVGLIFGAGYAAIFWYGGIEVAHHVLTIGELWVFLVFVNQVFGPLQAVSASGASLQAGTASAQRVFEVLDRDPIIQDAPDAIHFPKQPRILKLEHVSFAYRKESPVLCDVNVNIEPGKMVAFVGSSGVGKTTLLNLLPRFYDPTEGTLKLDDTDIRKIKVRDLRAHVALVLQENLVLPTTVSENIAYGRPSATAAQIAHAAKLAGAAAFIEKLPQGYETQVNESGGNLSGGQRQRIGIARALLTEAPLMVFDEPTSALDPQHEAMFTQTIRELKRQRTIVLVSHRLSTVVDCDEIYVMDEGAIVERGTHTELLAKRGLYYSMARHQLQIEEPAAT